MLFKRDGQRKKNCLAKTCTDNCCKKICIDNGKCCGYYNVEGLVQEMWQFQFFGHKQWKAHINGVD